MGQDRGFPLSLALAMTDDSGNPLPVRMMTEDDLMRELIEFAGHKYVIRIDGQQLTALVAAIQLACRNPNFRGPTRVLVEEIVHQLQRIAKRGAPDLDLIHDVLKFGWNSELDGSSISHG